ncbi:MAG TPA: PDR/VanB family oxidoreductase [Pseudolysinimonas sp.]|nr:PDR/VanB family oxidoreductase [Pseudolysinimonas sp.]
MSGLDLVLSDRHRTTHRISTFTFQRADGQPLPQWEPGAHISLRLPGGHLRDYSLCGDPAEELSWTVAVQRDPTGRGGSMELHDNVAIGDRVRSAAPVNSFHLRPAGRYLFIAGGIGITPIVPMIESLERSGHSDWSLLYLVRERREAVFLDRLSDPERVTLWVSEEQGRFDLTAFRERFDDGTEIYACGPTGMLTQLEEMAADAGDRFHREFFSGVADIPLTEDEAFEVILATTGTTVTVHPHESILSAVEAAVPGLSIYQSCLEGVCGSCETAVLAGVPDHRDLVLTRRQKERNDRMMICVSRCEGTQLTLEL